MALMLVVLTVIFPARLAAASPMARNRTPRQVAPFRSASSR
jgi:hypothetical protein